MGWKMNSHEKARKSDGRKKAQKDAKNWDAEILRLCDTVRETSFAIHKFLRSGHLEKIYENALAHRLRKAGVTIQQQFPLDVCDEDGTPLGHLVADLFIEECLIVEIKACRTLADEHIAQLLGYLRASGVEHGLLINFGGQKLQIKKYAMSANAR